MNDFIIEHNGLDFNVKKIEKKTEFISGSRYLFDFGVCSTKNGFAQIDTNQDASYYGNWCNPFKLVIFSYIEGDCITIQCHSKNQFVCEIRKMEKWHHEQNSKFKLDYGFNDDLKAKLIEFDLSDLFY